MKKPGTKIILKLEGNMIYLAFHTTSKILKLSNQVYYIKMIQNGRLLEDFLWLSQQMNPL